MMQQKLIFCLLAVMAFFTACSSDDPTITILTNDASGAPITQINLGANKDTKGSVVFESSDDWEAIATLSDGKECDWLVVSPAQGKAGKVTLTVKAKTSNMTGEIRTGTLTLYGDGKALQNLSITQDKMGFIEL
ncbi:MAG: BACON domain-containing protein [Bacteroides sp.]